MQLTGGRLVVSHYQPFHPFPRWLEHDNWRVRLRNGRPYDAPLQDVVALIPEGCLILLDPKLKRGDNRAELADALARKLGDGGGGGGGAEGGGGGRDRYRVSTSGTGDLERYRAAGFRTWRTIGSPQDMTDVLDYGPLPDEGVSVRHSLLTDAKSVERLHDAVGTVVAWTVNHPARARRLREYGVDGITTDRVPALAALAG